MRQLTVLRAVDLFEHTVWRMTNSYIRSSSGWLLLNTFRCIAASISEVRGITQATKVLRKRVRSINAEVISQLEHVQAQLELSVVSLRM